jgi:hypothetical protein
LKSSTVSRWPIDRARIRRAAQAFWRGRAPRHTLYLHPQGLTAWRAGAVPTAPEHFADFDAWCRAHPGSQARLLLSGKGLHSLLIDPGLSLGDEETLRTYARQQFAHYHGAPARQWPIAVWSDGKPEGHAGACALHGFDLDALRASAKAHQVHLTGVAPLWSAGLGSLAQRVPAFGGPGRHALALVEGRLVTWLVTESGAVTALRQRHLDAPDTARLAALLNDLSAGTEPLSTPPLLVGWGLDDDAGSGLPAQALTPLHTGSGALGPWVLDAMGTPA